MISSAKPLMVCKFQLVELLGCKNSLKYCCPSLSFPPDFPDDASHLQNVIGASITGDLALSVAESNPAFSTPTNAG